ncbi:unnamed protein product, partial [Symbiodinium necroappetens]
VPRSKVKNVYVRIPHALKGGVPDSVFERLMKFYRQTFWSNFEALAKRGLNVVPFMSDMLGFSHVVLLVSGGDTSFSRQAMYAHNFAYFDPNIWYNEDEMRKQIEQLNGCFILTGQEAPGTSRRLREDLYKKFLSGEGISGRKPYGLRTRMIECIGWKRLEANRLFQFLNVSKRDFNAILRRSLVFRIKARFEDPAAIAGAYSDIHLDGVFAKDEELKSFLTSGPAVLAALQLQHAFETEHSQKDCVQVIENFVQWGGDRGLTEATMREACGMPPRDVRQCASRVQAVIQIDDEEELAERDPDKFWKNTHTFLMNHMLTQQREDVTKGMLDRLKFPQRPNVIKEEFIKSLQDNGLLVATGARGKASDVFRVHIKQSGLDNVAAVTRKDDELIFPEMYHIEAFEKYVNMPAHRRENANILGAFYVSAKAKPARGRPFKGSGDIAADFCKRGQKLLDQEDLFDEVIQSFNRINISSQPSQAMPAKRRRCGSGSETKQVKDELKEPKAELEPIVHVQCQYKYSDSVSFRSRKTVIGTGMQRFCRRAQVHLAADTVDLDVHNSAFTVFHQLLPKLACVPEPPDYVKEVLDKCARDRNLVCSDILKTSQVRGKQLLTKVLFGGAVPRDVPEGAAFLVNLKKASIYLRWLASSMFPDTVAKFAQPESKKTNPTNSVLSHLYQAIEDYVLSAFVEYLLQFQPQHLSLHYDGVRVSKGQGGCSTAELCEKIQAYILRKTGFDVTICEKKHLTVLEILKGVACSVNETGLPETSGLRRQGNCIPAAVALLQKRVSDVEGLIADAAREENKRFLDDGCRSYKDCMSLLAINVLPLPDCTELATGLYLLHAEGNGTPHCVGLEVSQGRVNVHDVLTSFAVAKADFQHAVDSGIDRSACLLFRLSNSLDEQPQHDGWDAAALKELGDLKA